MTTTWMFIAAALALVPLGSPGAARLDALGGVGSPGWALSVRIGETAAVAAAGAAVMVVVWLGGPLLAMAAGLALLTAGRLLRRVRAGRSASRAARSALDIVRLVQAEVAAGSSASDAVAAASVVGSTFSAELEAMAGALRQARNPSGETASELAPLAHALRVSASSGAALAGVLSVVAAQLQAALDRATAVSTALAGARSSAALLAVLPAVGLALGAALGADPLRVLFATDGGHLLLISGVALECLGLLWTSRLAASAERA